MIRWIEATQPLAHSGPNCPARLKDARYVECSDDKEDQAHGNDRHLK